MLTVAGVALKRLAGLDAVTGRFHLFWSIEAVPLIQRPLGGQPSGLPKLGHECLGQSLSSKPSSLD